MTEKTSRFGCWRSIPIDRLSGCCLIAAGLFVLWVARDYTFGDLAAPGAGFVPFLLAVGLIVSGVLIAVTGGGSVPLRTLSWSGSGRALAIVAICSFGALGLERLGYRITIFIVMMAFLAVLERRPILHALLTAAGFSLGSYFLFHTLLDVQLPLSPWGF